MIELLIQLLVIIIVFAVIWYALTLVPLPQPWLNLARLVFAAIFVIILLYMLLGVAGVAPRFPR